MQTGIKLFDFTPRMPSLDGRRIVPAATKQGAEPSPDQLNGFMEIMGALISLPPDQWEESLASLEALSIEGDSPFVDSQDAAASDMLQLLLNLNGAVQHGLQQNEAQDKAHLILDMAKAFINDHRAVASNPDDGAMEDWKSRWLQVDERNFIKIQRDKACQDEGAPAPSANPSVPNEIPGNGVLPAGDKAGAQRGQQRLVGQEFHSGLDSDGNPLPDAEPLEKTAGEMSPKPSPASAALIQAADSLAREAKNKNSGGEMQQIGAEISKSAVGDKSVGVDRQSISDTDSLDSEMDASSLAQTDNAEDHALQKPSAPSGGHQGLLSRIDPRHHEGMFQVTGAQEAMSQDKEMQSDVIRQIVQRMSMHTQGPQSKMVIHLKPEFLGDVHMQVLTENHQVTVRMMTDSFVVKDIVEQNLQHLRSELQHHGLEIQKFDVFVANDNDGWKHGQNQAGFQQTLQHKQQRSGGGNTGRQGAKSVSRPANQRPFNRKELNEIDYFA